LNLFLELLARRDDGFHEIDTVMVPIDWCDDLQLCRTTAPGIQLTVDWLPSRDAIAAELGLPPKSKAADQMLAIPKDDNNLVHRALARFIEEFSVDGGFDCTLGKSIPAGAGMGGASSDAASALRCAALLCGVDTGRHELHLIAEEIGSDVPFFMGRAGDNEQVITAARATGRGENIESVTISNPLNFLVVFPAVTLQTALVYADSQVPRAPQTADQLIAALQRNNDGAFADLLLNRLQEPAKKIAPQINEILKSMWRIGLGTCQLTGSGSACFAIVSSAKEAKESEQQLRAEIFDLLARDKGTKGLGVRAKAVRSVTVPAKVELLPTS
jgi:4-diphosphocytidyl-2-C-methyl-D-erythritol kinase